MSRSRLLLAAGLILALIAGAWLLQPDRRLQRSWGALIDAVEARHARALGNRLAEDYGDRWGYTRTTLVSDARLAFHHFDSIEIRIDDEQIRRDGDSATITALLRIEVRGTDRAAEARVATNALFSPFVFEWRRADRFPWGWELVRFDQAELDLNRFRRGMPGGF